MRKLVRDRVPALMRSDGIIPALSVLTYSEYKRALFDKLLEEAQEAHAANNIQMADLKHVLEELCDVMHVLEAIQDLFCEQGQTEAIGAAKLARKGGFTARLAVEFSDDGALIGNDTGTFIPTT